MFCFVLFCFVLFPTANAPVKMIPFQNGMVRNSSELTSGLSALSFVCPQVSSHLLNVDDRFDLLTHDRDGERS